VRRDNAARSGDSIAGKQLGSNGFKNIAEQWLSGRGLIHHRHSGMRLSGKHRFPSGKFF
jgi:Na+-transporting NADH:ubiquinone oxidoreductase subunit NqrC